jgi:hypothetical protein
MISSSFKGVAMLKAFEILGYGPTAHGFTTFQHHKDNLMWHEGVAAKFPGCSKVKPTPLGRKEFDQLLGQYEVVSDIPVITFSKELIEAYPEAKVVIVERDIESWFKSYQVAWKPFDDRFAKRIVKKLDDQMAAALPLYDAITRGWFQAKTKKELLANERGLYKAHYEMIREVCPKERLLEFKLGDGWGPLCEFLGKEIPDVEFPRVNDKGEYEHRARIMTDLMIGRILKRKEKKAKKGPVKSVETA